METRAQRVVVFGALAVILTTLFALYVAAQPAVLVHPTRSLLSDLANLGARASGGPRVPAPEPYVLTAGSPWLRLGFAPMLILAAVLVVRPRVAGAVMWSLASLGIGGMVLIVCALAPTRLPQGASVGDLWPRTALPIAIAAIFALHVGILAGLALVSRRPKRPRSALPRAVARV